MSIHPWSRRFFCLIVALVLVTACGGSDPQPDLKIVQETDELKPMMETLVSAEWLSENLDDPDLVVLDCNVRVEMSEEGGIEILSGRADYEAGHIPSAGFADLMGELSDAESSHGFAVPSPERFCDVMGELGVGDDSRVVLYDASGSGWAARVWWMLRWVGFDRAALLDGGFSAWTAEGRPLSTEPPDRPANELTLALRPHLIADRDEVFAAIGDDTVAIIDALPESSFRGEMAMYHRPGHIPGALNIPSMALLDESGHYRSPEELAAMHHGDRDARAITYCGGGIAASSNAFVMTRLGFADVAVYTASLQEWAADPANPMEVDAP